jgi:methionine-rich copper-binding protein CopC
MAAFGIDAREANADARLHLRLVSSQPAQNDTVAAPKVIRLTFSLKPALPVTGLKLFNAAGREVPIGDVVPMGTDRNGVEATVGTRLAAGTYRVAWKTASTDMHPVRGEYTFVVK